MPIRRSRRTWRNRCGRPVGPWTRRLRTKEPLELPVIAEVAPEESDLEALARHIRHILEREYNSEPEEEEEPRDILELEYTLEPELRDILELEYTSEQEEVELRDNGQRLGLEYTLEPELRDSGSPRSHGLGALLP